MRVVLTGGAGGVGTSLAYNLLLGPGAHEIVLIDPRTASVASHAMDFEQVLELGATGSIVAGDSADLAGADVVVVTASAPLRPNASRQVFLDENAVLVGEIAATIAGLGPDWPGVVVMVTNPVDPLVMHMVRRSGLDRRRVIGYTLNDSLRLRSGIARALGRPPGSVEAWVLGEHGDGSVPLFSRVRVDGEPVTLTADQQAAARTFLHGWYVRHVALDPTRTSTWTSGRGLAQMLGALDDTEPTLFPSSVLLDGEYGLHDVSLGVPTLLARHGVAEIAHWDLDAGEAAALGDAAALVRAAGAHLEGSDPPG